MIENGAVGSRDGIVMLTATDAVGPTDTVKLRLDGAVGPLGRPGAVEFGKIPVAIGRLVVTFAKLVVRMIDGTIPVPGNEVLLNILRGVGSPVLPGTVILKVLVGIPVDPGKV